MAMEKAMETAMSDVTDTINTPDPVVESNITAIKDKFWAIKPESLMEYILTRQAGNQPTQPAQSPQNTQDTQATQTTQDTQASHSFPFKAKLQGSSEYCCYIEIDGVITSDAFDAWWWGGTSIQSIQRQFNYLINDSECVGIILKINSPGGEITGIHEFANTVYNARGSKPIIAYVYGMCASAAYWIASACDSIVCDRTATLGSLGVVASWDDFSQAYKRAGIIHHEIVSSQTPLKRQDMASDEGKQAIQDQVNALADIFIECVARFMGVSVEYINKHFGGGAMLLAEDAIKVGMAHALGSMQAVIEKVATSSAANIQIKSERKEVSVMADTTNVTNTTPDTPEPDTRMTDAKATELYKLAYEEGVKDERNRLQAIVKIADVQGYTEAVKSAMFTTPITAEKLALTLVMKEDVAKKTYAQNMEEDNKEMPDVKRSNTDENTPDNSAVNDIIKGYGLADDQRKVG